MKTPEILKASPNDAKVLSSISKSSKNYWGYPSEWINMWLSDLTITTNYIEQNEVCKLMLEDKIIGFCSFEEEKEHYMIGHFWILPDYIGKGFGKLLLDHILKTYVNKPKEIHVLSDPNAVSFYEKHGFETFRLVDGIPEGRKLPLMRRTHQVC